ncbi:hypothetical protein JW813_16805 [Clostridium botulinum]|uniref:hypothetical protein n=1 Tax=Clostridium botulinum TaxID=1491 RepID=UPI0022471799|nr:hypothetical protein [Clostridium botulinum]UZP03346.1 hypothetical protein JW813_16805 [Clostridium botulinum]UZP06704.1 hypothetical protein JYA71_17075 [Clostridium botulinum]UZP10085.1 hypothetical protein JYA74_16800 [Clostridium botulinum]
MEKSKRIESVVKRVGEKYLISSKELRVTIGEILLGKLRSNYETNKKSDEHN